jgi:hypothetical protein
MSTMRGLGGWKILKRLFPADAEERIVLVLKEVYLDDAGTDESSEICICAGYIARWRKWRVLEKKWKRLIQSYGMRHFSMKDWITSSKDWSKEKRDRFMGALLQIIIEHVECGFIASIHKEDYLRYVPEKFRKGVGPPYAACVQLVIGMVENYRIEVTKRSLLEKPAEHIAYFFERGTKGLGSAIEAAENYLYAIGRSQYREFFTVGKNILSSNVADVIAYECNKRWRDLTNGIQKPRYTLTTLLDNIPHRLLHFQGEDLTNLEKEADAHLEYPKQQASI